MILRGIILLATLLSGGYLYMYQNDSNKESYTTTNENIVLATTSPVSKTKIIEPITTLPSTKLIPNLSWVGQTFNNCSSVGLMIALSHWGIIDTQEKIAEATRPWNNRNGDNDDKSVTLYELADYAKANYGLLTYVRPNGNIELLKKFVANDIPVLTRALMYPKDDIVHYRVIRGYDENKRIVIETDGIEGRERPYTYEEWMHMWKDFNYSYLIIVPKEKQKLVESILKEETDEKMAWQNAKVRAIDEVSKDPSNLRSKYNEITAMYYLGDYEGTVREFEKIEDQLTRRKLWYQGEPIDAYFKLAKYDRVIELVDKIANDNNKSISELYVLKGKILESRGDTLGAKAEYEKAVYYNKHLKSAQESLKKISN